MSKILIVEDDISIQALLHDFIQEAGHSVVLAADGVEALAKYSEQTFDLVLLDIMLVCIFQSFCKRVLHNEACNAHEEIRRRRAKEVSFSDLALHEERQLYTLDKYFQAEEAEPSYQQAGKKITPKLLLEAIRTLPEEKRKAIMLYYFEGMTDVEIGKLFNTSRSTIQYRRTSSFEILKKYLEEHADEWDEW